MLTLLLASAALLTSVNDSAEASSISWKGAPVFKGDGYHFKVRGRVQYDIGYVTAGKDVVDDAYDGKLGFGSTLRRARLGVQGGFAGGFGYKAELDFAGGKIGYKDMFISYKPKGSSIALILGNQNTLHNMEQTTSSLGTSFMERAGFTAAFNADRRIGLSVNYADGPIFAGVGIFNEGPNSGNDNDGWLFGVRAGFMPKFGSTKLHIGLNFQHTSTSQNDMGVRSRTRPYNRTFGQRLVDSTEIASKGYTSYGAELAAVSGALHFASEFQMFKVRAVSLSATESGVEGFSGTRVSEKPGFKGGYVELGWFLTGESRKYSKGKWKTTKVLNPIDKGGYGALQLVARYDYLNLSDKMATATSGATSPCVVADTVATPYCYVNGGKQSAIMVGLNWQPVTYVRFMANYGRISVKNVDVSTGIVSHEISTTQATGKASLNIIQLRAQVSF